MALNKDKLTVRLLTRIANVGREGEIIEVSRTQARNYLIPKGLAKEVSEKDIIDIKKKEEKRQENLRALSRDRHDIAKNLNGKELSFELSGIGSKVFGGLNEHDIMEKVKHEFGLELEKSHVLLPEGKHIKKTGEHAVKIHLGEDAYIRLNVKVTVKEQK
jgi:large subunit ribosomal protein L9